MEACPYTIQKGKDPITPIEDGRDTLLGNSRDKHENQSRTPDNATSNANGIVEAEGQYSPWMVVARKRSGYKGTKHDPNLVRTSKSHWEAAP